MTILFYTCSYKNAKLCFNCFIMIRGLYFILTIKENLLLLLMRNIGSILHAYINMNHGTYIQHHFVLPDLAGYILLLTVASNRDIHFKK